MNTLKKRKNSSERICISIIKLEINFKNSIEQYNPGNQQVAGIVIISIRAVKALDQKKIQLLRHLCQKWACPWQRRLHPGA